MNMRFYIALFAALILSGSPVIAAGEVQELSGEASQKAQEAFEDVSADVSGGIVEALTGSAEVALSDKVAVPPALDWMFNGPLGTFERNSMQRGFQVYKQVCAACHGLERIAYRNLAALGYTEGQIKAFAAEATVKDGPNDEGEMFERPGRAADYFPKPFANEEAARYANNGAYPLDLSLIVRARSDGSNYLHALLTGYSEAPAGFELAEGMYYNRFFAGHQIAMAPPLSEGVVTYEDGTEATLEQMAHDVTVFLTWASEPMMEKRKQIGVKVVLYLLVFAGLMYAVKRKVWKDVE